MSLPRLIQVEARAKLNLGLAIGPRRPDGFHELATVFQTVSLADTLVAERRARGFSLEVRHENAAVRGALPVEAWALVPAGPRNLAFRAAQLAARHAGLRGGVHLRLVKRIPAQAGLGGGSADAAAALVAVLALCGARVPLADRLALGAELGADVPFALLGGVALGLGRGDRLTKLAAGRPFRAMIAMPRWRVPTARAFRDFDQLRYGLTWWRAKLRCAKAVGSMALEPQRALRMGNSFEEALGARRSSFIGLRARLRGAGLVQPHLTGSGSAVFGLLEPRASVGKALERLRGDEVIYLVHSARRALEIRRLS